LGLVGNASDCNNGPVLKIEQMRAALVAKHAAELEAFEKFAPLFQGLLPTDGATSTKRKTPPRAGTGKIRNAVLAAFSRDFLTAEAVAKQTGFTIQQVRGVVTAPVLKTGFMKKEIEGVMHYKFQGAQEQ
jgi:hypothetical protein